MNIIGYTYEADVHCVACTRTDFQWETLGSALDREGNPIHPIFSTDEQLTSLYCGDCGELIRAGEEA